MPTWTSEQKDAIYKSGTNIIVSAGAGSGKTAVLTARVLHKLSLGIHVNELLILTFTKAAAAEMKERIRKNLKKNPELSNELSLLDTAYVTTFDSFALSIVKKYHYLLNISANIAITEDVFIEILRKDTLREVLDSYYEQSNEQFLSFIDDFCVKNDEEIYQALLTISKKLENNFMKIELLENYQETYFSDEKINQYLEDFKNLLIQKQQNIKNKIEEMSLIAPKDYIGKINANLNILLQAQSIDELVSVKSSKLPPLPKNSEEELKFAKEDLSNSLKDLISLLEYGTEENLKKDLEQMAKYAAIFCQILMTYFETLAKRKKEKEYYDFNDIAFLALNLLKENKEVREEISSSFKEIMIDEYQDTNDIQEELISLISNNNVYMVGDIKQSIYRFRNANPYLFKMKYDNYRQGKNGEKIDLLKNFRSRKEVLQNINQIFNLIMDDELGGANYVTEHQMIFGNQEYLEKGNTKENYHMDILTYQHQKELGFTKEEIEIFTIGNDIKNKISQGYLLYDKDNGTVHKASYKDFVILIDRSTSFELYKKIFNYLQIPIDLLKDEAFNNSTCFLIIKNIIKAIISYDKKNFDAEFRFAFTSVVRSFLYEYQDATIYAILESKSWYKNDFYQTIKPILENLSIKTITEIITEIYTSTHFYDKIIKIGNVKENMIILNYIYSLAENYQQEGKSIEAFYEFLTRINKDEMQIKYNNSEQNEESVKIMTIHKSKGLEYPICYFSGLYKSFNIADVKDHFLYDKKYGIITALKKEGLYSCFLKELVKNDYLKEEISEKLRLFYVAATRAKEKMIFVLPKNPKDKCNLNIETRLKSKSFADFLYSIWDNLKEFQTPIDLQKIHLTKNYLINLEEKNVEISTEPPLEVQEINLEMLSTEKQKFSKKNVNFLSIEDYKNMKMGIKIHEYLENIDFSNPNYSLIPEKYWQTKIKNFLNCSVIKEHLNAEIYKEYEFIYEEKNTEYHGIIDLMLIEKEQIIIVDYKLDNILDEEYIKQLVGYQKYISRKIQKKVEIYLYSILSEKIIPIKANSAML